MSSSAAASPPGSMSAGSPPFAPPAPRDKTHYLYMAVIVAALLGIAVGFAFPGNVRQLENICHWLTVMAPGQRVDVTDLPPEVRETPEFSAGAPGEIAWHLALDRELAQALTRGERNVGDRLEQEFEKTLIRRALVHTGGHRMEAAAWLGWGRNTLTRKIQELGLEAELRKGERSAG